MSSESKENSTPVMLAMLSGILVTIVAMILAIYIAGQRPVVVVVNPTGQPVAGAAPAPGGVAAAPAPTPAAPVGPEIAAPRVAALPPLSDPLDKAWDKAAALEVPLMPQTLTTPMLDTPSIPSVRVQALRDGGKLAFRLSWASSKPSSNVDTNQFSDAVAVQLPLEPDTPFMMGGPGKPVRILHWKALWQKDADVAYQDVQHLHPNYWSDFYWFSGGKFPFPISDAFKDPIARQWLVAFSAGNPMANHQRKSPVEEVVAAGFGTATHLPEGGASAKGLWKDGRWTVVIERSLTPGEALGSAIQAGKCSAVSFAVWDGTAGNVGGKKHWCNWVPLKVEP